MRDRNGRFIKGVSYSPSTQFKPGEHWRKPQIFRDKDWLTEKYISEKLSSKDIANLFGVTDAAIIFWLKKHDITRRTTSETRAEKYWGSIGADNPMWNGRGELNPRWLGGVTPQRQAFYQSAEWKAACKEVWKRDRAICQRCGLRKKDDHGVPFHIHHVTSFAVEELRADVGNLILLCEVCHHFVHSKENKNGEYLR